MTEVRAETPPRASGALVLPSLTPYRSNSRSRTASKREVALSDLLASDDDVIYDDPDLPGLSVDIPDDGDEKQPRDAAANTGITKDTLSNTPAMESLPTERIASATKFHTKRRLAWVLRFIFLLLALVYATSAAAYSSCVCPVARGCTPTCGLVIVIAKQHKSSTRDLQ